MTQDPAPVSLAGTTLDDTRHVCALFNDEDEEYRVLLPFIKDGFERGDKALHVLGSGQRQDHLHRLGGAGIDTAAAETRGQLELLIDTDTYLWEGEFDQDRMLDLFEQLANGERERGYPRTRIVCRMDWAAEDRWFVDDVIEFESRVNDIWRRHDHTVICTYRLDLLTGDAVINIMRTHPMVIIGGFLHRNPFFVPPDQFVPEFRERRKRHASPDRTVR